MIARNVLGESPWLSKWNSSDIDLVFRKSELHDYKKGDLVCQDFASPAMYFLASGSVWACLRNESGSVKFGIVTKSTLLGLSQLLGNSFQHEAFFEFYAAEDTTALIIPTKVFMERLEAKPNLWRSVTEASIFYQRQCIRLALLLNIGSIKDRLISAIYQYGLSKLLKPPRTPMSLVSVSQEDLADLTQSSRQHVNRALRELEADGLLSLGYKRIDILDPIALENLALARLRQAARR